MPVTAERTPDSSAPRVAPEQDQAAKQTPDHVAHRALLTGLYLELSAEIDHAARLIAEVVTAASQGGDDDADNGTRMSHREQQASLIASIDERRSQVEHAIARLDAGQYGRCEECGGDIPAARLEAFPSVTTCVDCKRRAERHG